MKLLVKEKNFYLFKRKIKVFLPYLPLYKVYIPYNIIRGNLEKKLRIVYIQYYIFNTIKTIPLPIFQKK